VNAPLVVYAVLGVLLIFEAFWNIMPVFSTSQPYENEVEVSAARRLPGAPGVEDAIY
jgi:hypothetical protein